MIVGSRRKQRGALRTHDSAGETPPARACAAQPPPPYAQAGHEDDGDYVMALTIANTAVMQTQMRTNRCRW